VGETVVAKKVRLGPADALALARKVSRVVATKGKRVEAITVKGASDAELLAVLLGPTGMLRAPTAVVGKTLLVGFNAEAYAEVLAAK
jgi:arsenate reductase-like glutaredoxin family protein